MKRSILTIPWPQGLHLRPAARLVKLSQRFHSTIILRCGGTLADARSIFSILALCAVVGTSINVEVSGDDELDALQAVEAEFAAIADDAPASHLS